MRLAFVIIFIVPILIKDVKSKWFLIETLDEPQKTPDVPDTQQQTDAPVAPTLPPSPTENPRGPYGQRKPKPSKGGSVNGTSTSRVIPRGCFDRWGSNFCSRRVSERSCREWQFQQNCELSCGSCDCDRDQFTCTSFIPGRHDGSEQKCIRDSWLCDGDRDCPGGEDEGSRTLSCRGPCRRDQFECNNGQCIPADYECDGYSIWGHDCDDRSDEHWRCNR